MSDLVFVPDCFTYKIVRCYVCNVSIVPDDQEVILSGKRYVCVCLRCAIAINKKRYDAVVVNDVIPHAETLELIVGDTNAE